MIKYCLTGLVVLLACSGIKTIAFSQPAGAYQTPAVQDSGTAALWRDRGDAGSLNLLYGAGSQERQPAGTFTFVKEDKQGTAPKFEIVDGQGVHWKAKLGEETKSETAASRLVWAAGYFTDEDYYLPELRVDKMAKLDRGRKFVTDDGVIHGARLERSVKGQKKNGNWTLEDIHTFTGGADGADGSVGRLVFHGGHLYGTAVAGGGNGEGTVYELTPAKRGEWPFRIIYTFKGPPDGGFAYGGMVFDTLGNLYGTAYHGGANDFGCVFQLTPRQNGEWKEAVLYSFKGGKDGESSIGNLVLDQSGNLYGTTSAGGSAGTGVIFGLTPLSRHKWKESVVHTFQGPPDGAFAYNGMVDAGAGTLYGVTVHGGTDDEGAIFTFTP